MALCFWYLGNGKRNLEIASGGMSILIQAGCNYNSAKEMALGRVGVSSAGIK